MPSRCLAPTARRVFDLVSLAERSLLAVDVDGPGLPLPACSTRSVPSRRRWLEESRIADLMRRRHAEHFAGVAREIDRDIRTPDERSVGAGSRASSPRFGQPIAGPAAHDPELAVGPERCAPPGRVLDVLERADGVGEGAARSPVRRRRRRRRERRASGRRRAGGQQRRSRSWRTNSARGPPEAGTRAVRATALEILCRRGDLRRTAAPTCGGLSRGTRTARRGTRRRALPDDRGRRTPRWRRRSGATRGSGSNGSTASTRRCSRPRTRAWVAYTRGEALSAMLRSRSGADVRAGHGAGESDRQPVRHLGVARVAGRRTRAGRRVPSGASTSYSQLPPRSTPRHGNYVHAVTTLQEPDRGLGRGRRRPGRRSRAGRRDRAMTGLRPSYGERDRHGARRRVVVSVPSGRRLGAQRAC